MQLSVVLPVLNEAQTITATLARLRRPEVEIIVADGGSSDDTVARAKPLCERVVAAPRGRALQMNAGAAAANGDVLLFLHADTRLPDAAVTTIIDAIGAGASWGRFDVRIEGKHPLLGLIARMMNLRSRLTGIATGDQAIFCSRALFDSLGGYAPIALMEDIDFSRRARAIATPTCLTGTRHDVGTALGKAWRAAHRAAHVASAHALFFRRRSAGSRTCLPPAS
jgi:rSAM/selenodomain-associated transferase 2